VLRLLHYLKGNRMHQHIENALRAIRTMTDKKLYVEPGNSTTGISWALLDDEGFVLLKAKTRGQFIDKLEAFQLGCFFMGTE
jgi:predicted secreted protein